MNQVFSAMKALIKQDDKFLVIKQAVGENIIWDLPGGKIEFGETPFDALRREVKEELAAEIQIIKPLGVWWFFNPAREKQVICNTYICSLKNSAIDITQNPADENILEYRWVTKEEFLDDNYQAESSLKDLIAII